MEEFRKKKIVIKKNKIKTKKDQYSFALNVNTKNK